MGVYDRQIATAKRLIAKFGQSVTWRVVADGTVSDADRPWLETPATPTDYTVAIAFLPLERQFQELLRYIKGAEVATGSIYGLMGAVTFTPSLRDVVLRSAKEYRIRSIDELAPNGEPILYTVEFDA